MEFALHPLSERDYLYMEDYVWEARLIMLFTSDLFHVALAKIVMSALKRARTGGTHVGRN